MTWFDMTVFAILGVSLLLGVMRGLVREVMALVSWIAAFVLARQFGGSVAVLLPATLQPAELRLAAGFVSVLLASLLVLWLAGFLLSELVKAAGLAGANRALGAVFGLVRGLVIVTIAVLVGGLTSLPRHPGWRNAWLSPPFEAAAGWAKAWLPETVKGNVHFETD